MEPHEAKVAGCGATKTARFSMSLCVPVHRLHRTPEDQGRVEPWSLLPPRCARAERVERAAARAERLARARPLERRERGAQVQGDVHGHDLQSTKRDTAEPARSVPDS